MLCDALWAVGAQGGIRTRNALEKILECRTGDSRAYSRPAPASRGPGYTTSTHSHIPGIGREPGIHVLGKATGKAGKLKPSPTHPRLVEKITVSNWTGFQQG